MMQFCLWKTPAFSPSWQLNLWVVFVFLGVCDYDLRSEIFSYR